MHPHSRDTNFVASLQKGSNEIGHRSGQTQPGFPDRAAPLAFDEERGGKTGVSISSEESSLWEGTECWKVQGGCTAHQACPSLHPPKRESTKEPTDLGQSLTAFKTRFSSLRPCLLPRPPGCLCKASCEWHLPIFLCPGDP